MQQPTIISLLPRYPTRSMDVPGSSLESSFVVSEVSHIIKETIERIIGGSSYQQNKVNRWTADIVDHVLTEITKLDKPFKYIVQAVVMQKNGAGLHTASSCYWDNTTDGSCTVRFVFFFDSFCLHNFTTMCGRFACGLAPDVVRRLCTYMNNETHEKTEPDWFNLMEQHGRDFKQSWNIAPTMTCLCLISEKHLDSSCDSSRYALCSMRWGLIPSYYQADIEKFSFTMNNCRSETIMEKPTFKTPFRNGQRCVVLAEGYLYLYMILFILPSM
ncbi:unnamed protein product [Didymodactylos carnosus]|uniref:Abasic site processing protein HMCES n=1 Tax=Didymodactylos carnosus TaxID=1234261 RepID=A0A8S2EJB7_9BILA|nr:unnamed protein product [Didymodactylos carnosus]CAF3974830.1 unnamed protein product [Didymodactylos carnosus]